MKLACPGCGLTLSLEALLMDQQAREAVMAALALPAPLGERVLLYLGLFRSPGRALSWDRAARLLTELVVPIAAAQITRDGRAWAAPVEVWRVALDQMLAQRDKLMLPLKTHGYLFEVVAGLASKSEAKIETARETRRVPRPAPECRRVPVVTSAEVASRYCRDTIARVSGRKSPNTEENDEKL